MSFLETIKAYDAADQAERLAYRERRYREAVFAALAAGKRGDEAEWHRLAAEAKAIREGSE